LRDRGLWYLDDFFERFGPVPRFIIYMHPRGLSLEEDFEVLAAAVDLAIMLRRRVVLPATMNCENCPAYRPYGMAQWPLDEEDLPPGCTFDYFSRAGLVTGEWLNFTAESGVAGLPAFRSLRPRKRVASLRQLRKNIGTVQGKAPSELFGSAAVVELVLDVRAVRDTLKTAVGGTALDTLPCGFRAWPATTYACRDAFLVPSSVSGAPQDVQSEMLELGREGPSNCNGSSQSECGPLPFMCCEVFFGWADKLEALGPGAPSWNLPCGCGLTRHCLRESGTDGQTCCVPHAPNAAKRFGQRCGAAPAPTTALPRIVPDDTSTYSSSALRELAKGRIAFPEAEKLCLADGVLHRAEAGPLAKRRCSALLRTFLGLHNGSTIATASAVMIAAVAA